MTRLAKIGVPFALLGIVLAAPAPAPAAEHRVNDLVVIEGTVLKFDALNGLNETTRDPEWQLEYMESLLSYKTEQDLTERGTMLEKRVSNGALCFECVIGTLKIIQGLPATRTFALGVCTQWCSNYVVDNMIDNASNYARELGWYWGNGPESYNKYTWRMTPRE